MLPRHLSNRTTPEEVQEHRDAQKLNDWKQALVKEHRGNCPPDLQRYLDEHMPTWRRYVNSGKGGSLCISVCDHPAPPSNGGNDSPAVCLVDEQAWRATAR